ncbi:transcriptional regulator, ArsR family [Longilinea arvoryzae]|uniref:Transcriptional regulator, ArsR family n=1 Tax=Longilinea arvoryzae TaxID=360412 RepID=A0A0K8MXZ9_9CHLR|nr:transcriptional regulator [Longilinea arvoryzae]GAP16128.1 transcriptional regulator, ArsR family [Longilinea arvoryzae]
MAQVFEELAGLDKVIHEPARLAILTALSACVSADFTFLQHLTGLTQGNLSGHLAKLEEAGLVKLEKTFVDRRPNTMVSLTGPGKTAIEHHWQQLEQLRKSAQAWNAKDNPE